MFTTLPVIVLMLLAGCFVAAGWPLLFLPRASRALAGAAGSGCMALGTAVVALIGSGLVQAPVIAAYASAADDVPIAAQLPAAESAPQAEATPAPAADSAASDPKIDPASEETIIIPPGRPEWVDKDPDYSGTIHTIPVSSGPYALENDSRRALDRALVKATSEYIADQLGSQLAPQFVRFDARTIKRRWVNADNLYHDQATYSIGKMHEYFALLEFDKAFRNELDRRWANVRATSRLTQAGLFSGAALLLVGSIFGYFRLDNATRGYYTGRLQFMTAAAILAIVGVGAVLAQWIHWL